MEECYTLLGISPTASTEEIEEAYQDKKLEIALDSFERDSEEWLRASSTLKELDRAYNDAIMATFAPIKAFSVSSPLPSLKQIAPQPTAPGASSPPPQERLSLENKPLEEDFYSAPFPYSSPSPSPSPFDDAVPVRSSYVRRSKSAPVAAEVSLGGLVEEVPVSFSDNELLNMDIGQLRESYEAPEEKSVLLTWGIRDKLLRFYVMAYVGFVIFELMINLWLGGYASFSIMSALSIRQMNRAADVMQNVDAYRGLAQPLTDAARQMQDAAAPPTGLMAILRAFVTTIYYFLCAMPMPIVTRFFIMGQPTEAGMTRWMLYSLSIAVAAVLHSLTGWMIGNWAGSGFTLAFVAIVLCTVTLRYEGN